MPTHFMTNVTTPFYVDDESKQRHDTLLKYFVKYHKDEVATFMKKVSELGEVGKIENTL